MKSEHLGRRKQAASNSQMRDPRRTNSVYVCERIIVDAGTVSKVNRCRCSVGTLYDGRCELLFPASFDGAGDGRSARMTIGLLAYWPIDVIRGCRCGCLEGRGGFFDVPYITFAVVSSTILNGAWSLG